MILPFIVVLLWGCERKPTACLDLPETLEAGTFLSLNSCSEDYEFLTWEFSDGIGIEGEIAQRNFEEEGNITIRLTAYANGAYKSDQVEESYFTSFRYIDRFEVIGNVPFDSLRVNFGNLYSFTALETSGSYSESNPLTINADELAYRIIAEPTSVSMFGLIDIVERPLISDKFNFDFVKDNPTIVGDSTDRYQLKIFWEYRSFNN
jgi:hypothetical protein